MQETFTVRGKDIYECKEIAKRDYGPRAQIIDSRTIQVGGLFGVFFTHDAVEARGIIPPPMPELLSKYSTNIFKPSQSAVDRALEETAKAETKLLVTAVRPQTDKNTDQGSSEKQMQEMLKAIKDVNEKIENFIPDRLSREHENITLLNEIMEQNDFALSYRKKIIDRVRKEISLSDLDDFYEVEQKVLQWIGESIALHDPDNVKNMTPSIAGHPLPRVFILVGATGVGKTTTIAKFASAYYKNFNLKVGLITIDYYRIGAQDQLKRLAEIMRIPFEYIDNEDDLKKTIAIMSNSLDVILVDSAGTSPRDAEHLAETKMFLDVCGSRAEVHLAIAASTKAQDISEIMRQFEQFAYSDIIITKIDETKQIGNVISALAENNKSISYFTNSQEIKPDSLVKANVMDLLLHLEGFQTDRSRLEARWGKV
ncbi:MAG: flagellar biosynthesis protein FlhF [Termitinemataceae bacterium]|nr:MAG: flagellar biosynthesis protein FlhF [Termitinemataceae bacterium]